ncbi:MAG: sodium:calcium antiporter [Candidatus Bathyarchaeia archaeon]
MVTEATVAGVALVLGIVLMTFSSDKAVVHSVKIASALRISPLMIGLILVSLGTDLPEIANSIASSALGHGDINVGDSLGSVLTQMSLVFGLIPFLGGIFRVKRKEIVVIGVCEVLALIIAVSVVEKGYISRMNALFLVASWPIFLLLTRSATARNAQEKEHFVGRNDESHLHHLRHWAIAILGFIGVAIGAYVVIQSVITLSAAFHISEYLLSFFLVAIGTSLPEVAIDLTAVRKKQYELAIGDAIGSCIADASFAIGIGPLLMGKINVSGGLAIITGSYAILVCIVIVSTLALRGKIDKKAGTLFLVLYLLSYTILRVI